MSNFSDKMNRHLGLESNAPPSAEQQTVFKHVFGEEDLYSPSEIQENYDLIRKALALEPGPIEVLKVAHKQGPLDAGDIPSKSDESVLQTLGFTDRIVVRGEDGFCAVTQFGVTALEIIEFYYSLNGDAT